ncbi:MAG: deoxyribose-phosphate aldolase [Anaerolineales bacterium]|nr:MAG: deoxyribose-phosphate aldolase [Anaerolineales bacterium]
MNRRILARYIDHTLLKAEATPAQITTLCEEALENHFAAVCINALYVPLAVPLCRGSDVAVCTVIGFQLGATSTAVKVCEAEIAMAQGATEIDTVIPVGLLIAQNRDRVYADIAALASVCHSQGAILKVILETALLTDEEKVLACEICKQAKADFVKTSTGFAKGGATAADIALMRKTVGPEMGIKAAGGIRNYETALEMIEAGATRIGASSSLEIMKGAPA